MVVVLIVVVVAGCLSIYLPIYLSIYLSICKLENEAILREFLTVWTWQHQKRSKSARLPELLKSTAEKTQQFCETSLGNIKNEAILRDFLQKWKVECRADRLVPLRFAIFPFHLFKVLRLPRKSEAGSYEVLHLSRKITFANLKIWCSKMQPLSGNQRPDLLVSLMNMSLVLRLPREMHLLCRSPWNVPRLPSFLDMLQNPHGLLTVDKVQNPFLALARQNHIWTSKSEPNPSVFNTFDLEMCFAPQRRTLFRHLNFQKCSEHEVLCTFWIGNVLCATTVCTCSTSQLPKMVWTRQFLTLLTSKCASRHHRAQLFISHMARWLRARRFSEPTFRPSGATKHWKNSESRLFYLFARLHLLPSDSFSSLIFFLLLFS